MIQLENILAAMEKLKGIVTATPLEHNHYLIEFYNASVFLKREDLQK
jgi:threonine dehydratase